MDDRNIAFGCLKAKGKRWTGSPTNIQLCQMLGLKATSKKEARASLAIWARTLSKDQFQEAQQALEFSRMEAREREAAYRSKSVAALNAANLNHIKSI